MKAEAKFKPYPDAAGKWRWRLVSPNGRIIADSGQGYDSHRDCMAGISLVKLYAPDAPVEQQAATR